MKANGNLIVDGVFGRRRRPDDGARKLLLDAGVQLEDSGHAGRARDGATHRRGAVHQIGQALHAQRLRLLAHHEADSVHQVRLACVQLTITSAKQPNAGEQPLIGRPTANQGSPSVETKAPNLQTAFGGAILNIITIIKNRTQPLIGQGYHFMAQLTRGLSISKCNQVLTTRHRSP